MKILIGYPPTESEKGTATLGQNRQFQWFSTPCLIFPIVPATAATMLKNDRHEVIWLDCIAEKVGWEKFIEILEEKKPKLFAFETKTPVIKQHWETINRLKERFPSMKIAIMGDHVTSFPEETFENSKVDFVITGGDYDFSLKELVNSIIKNERPPKGIYYRRGRLIRINGKFELNHNLDEAPFVDRDLTKWKNYQKEASMSGYPYFYIMSGRDCWWGKCKFCSWPRMYPKFRVRSVENVLDEIGMLIEKYGAKEIFDDSGTLMTGKWLKDLCEGLIKRGYNKKIKYSCNMRFGALNLEDYKLMKEAGFYMLKFGLESANQETLDILDKGIKVEDIINGCEIAKNAGLSVHLTMIVGYPWETKEDAMKTFELAKRLMQSGKADILQATILIPYPGTKLWKEAIENDWLLFDSKEYERYDQRESVLKTADNNPEGVAAICHKIHTIFLTPSYVYQRAKRGLTSWDEFKMNLRGVKTLFGKLKDFGGKEG